MVNPVATPARSAPHSRRAFARGLTGVLAMMICWLYFWTASSNNIPFEFSGKRNDYYNLLTRGFLQGRTSMDVAPLKEKRTAPDVNGLGDLPYLLDASFYQGKYYLYFGPAPVVTFFLPYRLLSGHEVSDNFVGAFFAGAGFLVSLGLLGLVRRRHFPLAGCWWMPLGALLLGLGNVCIVMLRHPMFYEATIACAYFFQALFFLAAYRALTSTGGWGRAAWLAVASLCAGLAVAARANHAFATLALGFLLGWLCWKRLDRNEGWRSAGRLVLAGLAPVAFCAAGLMAYNYGRFGSILEFGVSHQFTYRPVFGLQYLLHNLKLYYFSLPEFSWYFPFTLPIDEGVRPPGYVGFEHIHGQAWSVLLLCPVLGAAALLWSRRFAAERSLSVLYGCGLLAYLCNLAVLLCLGGRANRYMVDFQSALMLLAAISVLVLEREITGRALWRRLSAMGMAVLTLVIGLHNILSSVQLYELLKQANPPVYSRIATVMNAPSHWAGRWLYPREGPLSLQIRFPAAAYDEVQPLVVTGSAEYCDFLLVRFLEPGWVSFVITHHGYSQVTSEPVEVGIGRPHAMRIDLGSLYPPQAHPFFAPFSRGESSLVKRNVRIELDGKTVYATKHDFYDASPDRIYVGENPLAPLYAGPRFTGTISEVKRAGLASLLAQQEQQSYGTVALTLTFPPSMADRGPEPLVVTGEQGRGDALLIKYVDDRHVRFALDHWGGAFTASDPIEIADPHGRHLLEISMGSLFPPAGDPRLAGRSAYELEQLKFTARVKLDGREVFRTRSEFHAAAPRTVDLGENIIGLSSCSGLFGGEIFEYSRLPMTTEAGISGDAVVMGPVRMHVTFPAGRTGTSEPLVATGEAGRGDMVFVTYLDEGTLRFSLDHWGWAGIASGPVAVDYRAEHVLEVEMGSLYPLNALSRLSSLNVSKMAKIRRQLRIRLDGREVLAATSDFYDVFAAPPEIGSNRIGISNCARVFSGVITQVERPDDSLTDASADMNHDYGPVRLALMFPSDRPRLAEPLLVSGRTGAGDVLSVGYPDGQHIQFSWDHWGAGGPSSELVAVDYKEWHQVEIDMGSLYPEGSAAMKTAMDPAEVVRRRRQLEVKIDGRTVFSAEGNFHPALATEVQAGSNPIGASSLAPLFTGSLETIQRPGVAAP